VIAFGFTALGASGITLTDGPLRAKTMGLIYHEGWWVWGSPTSEDFASAELVRLPVATYGSQVLASDVALEWLRALEPHLGAIMGGVPADRQATQRERARAMACIALLSFAIEGAGAKLVVKGVVNAGESIDAIAKTLGSNDLRSELDELIVLRNSVVHGHIWRIRHEWGPGAAGSTAEDRAYGRDDPRYRRVVPVGSRTTKRLGLHVVPGELTAADVRSCLPVAVRTFDHLATFDGPNAASLADIPLDLGGTWRSLRACASE
jgi:hypothetical protein